MPKRPPGGEAERRRVGNGGGQGPPARVDQAKEKDRQPADQGEEAAALTPILPHDGGGDRDRRVGLARDRLVDDGDGLKDLKSDARDLQADQASDDDESQRRQGSP